MSVNDFGHQLNISLSVNSFSEKELLNWEKLLASAKSELETIKALNIILLTVKHDIQIAGITDTEQETGLEIGIDRFLTRRKLPALARVLLLLIVENGV